MTRAGDLLQGVRVLELGGGVALSYAGLLLADAGAEVIKIEPLTGDLLRLELPVDESGSAVFEYLNRGKKSVAIDQSSSRGVTVLRRLVASADTVLHCLDGDEGKTFDEVVGSARPLTLVECAISAYGPDGPLQGKAGAEVVVQGMSDYFSSLGQLGRPPVRIGADIAGMNTGVFAALAVVSGLLRREQTGRGDRASCSMLGSLIHLRGVMWGALSDPDEWWGFHLESEVKPPDEGWQTADAPIWFNMFRATSEDWDRLLIELDMIDAYEDPRFANLGRDAAGTGRYAHEVRERWESAFASHSSEELLALLKEAGANAVPMNDYAKVFSHPHLAARGLGLVRLASGHPVILSPWMIEAEISEDELAARAKAPRIGEHTDAVLSGQGFSQDELDDLRREAAIA